MKVWQKAHALMIDVHKKLVPILPKEERYDLTAQIRSSSKSVPANIAEGHGRYYYKEKRIGEKEPGANLVVREDRIEYFVNLPDENG